MSTVGGLQTTRLVLGTGRRKQLKPQRKSVDMENMELEENFLSSSKSRMNGEDNQSEEDKIQEYMQRSDTAVIFPEPVDHSEESRALKPKVYNEVESRLESNLKCTVCTKNFTSAVALQNHMTSCTVMTSFLPSPPNTCLHCGTSFTTQELLEKHEIIHSPNTQVSCTICKKTFANVYRLQRHMISHDESIVLRKFKCPECGKAFKFKHHLKEHIRIHSGEKPFQCPNCGKRFSHSGSYSSHMTSKKCLTVGIKNGNRGRVSLDKAMSQLTGRRTSPVGKMGDQQEDVKIPFHQSLTPSGFLNPPSYTTMSPMAVTTQYSSHFTPSELPLDKDIKPPAPEVLKPSPVSPLGVNGESKSDSCRSDDEEKPLVIDDKTEDNSSNDGLDSVNKILENVASGAKTIGRMGEAKNGLVDHHPEPCEYNGQTREGLALKLEVMVSGDEVVKPEVKSEFKCDESKTDGSECDSNRDENEEGNGRKVRVRSLISEEQLTVLKRHYSNNPRPKKDEIERIAAEIRFSPRVVKVWFQNTRARDRREGKNIHIPFYPMSKSPLGMKGYGNYQPLSSSPYSPIMPHYNGVSSRLPLSMLYNHGVTNFPASSPGSNNDQPSPEVRPRPESDGPLDLSTKKSTPSSSPRLLSESDCDNTVKGSPALSPSLSTGSTPSLKGFSINNNLPSTDSPLYKYLPKESMSSMPARPDPYLKIPEDRTKAHPDSLDSLISRNDLCGEFRDVDRLLQRSSPESSSLASHGEDICMDREMDDIAMGIPAKKRKPWKPCKSEDIEGHYTCDQCDKTFSKQSSLARHKYEHSGQRPHKCDVCSKAFKHKHHLTEHKRLHSGEKPFQCSKCLKRFSHSGSYSQHMNHRYSYCKPYRE